jgi:hypothetical protein
MIEGSPSTGILFGYIMMTLLIVLGAIGTAYHLVHFFMIKMIIGAPEEEEDRYRID